MYVGPNIVGGDTYDDFCMFVNDVDLDKFQVHFLREKVNKVRGPITRPFYVCTMKKSNIKAKTNPKMVNQQCLFLSSLFHMPINIFMHCLTLLAELHKGVHQCLPEGIYFQDWKICACL